MAIILVNNKDNSLNWIGDTWDPNLSLESVTKYELAETSEQLLGTLDIHNIIWNGTTLIESPFSLYSKTEEFINDSATYEARLASGMNYVQAREGLFLNIP